MNTQVRITKIDGIWRKLIAASKMMKVPKTTKIEKQSFRFTLIQAGKVPVELGWRGAIGRNGKKAKKLNVFVSFRPMPLSLRSRFLCLVDRKRKRLLGKIKPKPWQQQHMNVSCKQLVYPITLRAKKQIWYFYRESLGQVAWWWIKEKKNGKGDLKSSGASRWFYERKRTWSTPVSPMSL